MRRNAGISLVVLSLVCSPALAQETYYKFKSMKDIERIVKIAESGSDPTIVESSGDETDPQTGRPQQYVATVWIRNHPAFAFGKSYLNGKFEITLVAACEGERMMSYRLRLQSVDHKPEEVKEGDKFDVLVGGYGLGVQSYVMPAKVLSKQGANGRSGFSLFVEGMASPRVTFFDQISDTPNLEFNFRSNGVYIAYTGFVLRNADRDLNPILLYCRNNSLKLHPPKPTLGGPGTAELRKSRETKASGWKAARSMNPSQPVDLRRGPSAAQIFGALERDVRRRKERIRNAAQSCDESGHDIMSAMKCLASGKWAANTTGIDVSIQSVDLNECRLVTGGRTFCKYRAHATVSGAGPMGQMANSLMSQGVAWSCAEFGVVQDRWEVEKTYDSCQFTADGGVRTRELVQRP